MRSSRAGILVPEAEGVRTVHKDKHKQQNLKWRSIAAYDSGRR